jgi:hypothetical protein
MQGAEIPQLGLFIFTEQPFSHWIPLPMSRQLGHADAGKSRKKLAWLEPTEIHLASATDHPQIHAHRWRPSEYETVFLYAGRQSGQEVRSGTTDMEQFFRREHLCIE